MEHRKLGETDISLSVVTFGAWAIGGWMWGGADEKKAVEAILTSIDMGVTSIDTAPVYGYGRSEEIVAKAIEGRRDKVQLLTKFGLRWDKEEGEFFFEVADNGKPSRIYRNSRKKSIIEECENSLRRLKTDYIDLLQCHWRDHTTSLEEPAEALMQLIKDGKIRAAGVSNFTVQEIAEIRKGVPIASNQPPYSMVLRDIEKEIVPYCRENNISLIAYSPLQRGVLTGKFTPNHTFQPGDHRAAQRHFQPENIKRINAFLQRIKPIADGHGVTIGQLVINWTIQQPGITVALVGARDANQARENAQAAKFKLAPAEISKINDELNELELVEAAPAGRS